MPDSFLEVPKGIRPDAKEKLVRIVSPIVGARRESHSAFLGVSALLFAASVTVTINWCRPMSSMDMPMLGEIFATPFPVVVIAVDN